MGKETQFLLTLFPSGKNSGKDPEKKKINNMIFITNSFNYFKITIKTKC